MLDYARKVEIMLFMLLTETLWYLRYLLKRYAIHATKVKLYPNSC